MHWSEGYISLLANCWCIKVQADDYADISEASVLNYNWTFSSLILTSTLYEFQLFSLTHSK